MKGIEIEVVSGAFTRLAVDTLVVPVPSNERPLQGAAGWLDWRMCGQISQEIQGGHLSGEAHEALLLAGHPPVRASRVLLVGIGSAELLPGRGIQDAFRELTGRLMGLRSERAVVALPGSIDPLQDAEAVLRGCLQSASSSRGERVLRLMLPGSLQWLHAFREAAIELADETRRRQVLLMIEPSADADFGSGASPSSRALH